MYPAIKLRFNRIQFGNGQAKFSLTKIYPQYLNNRIACNTTFRTTNMTEDFQQI